MNNYKTALDKIKASDSFKTETVNILIEQQSKSRKTRFAPIAAVAAGLAVVIALGAFFFPFSRGESGFIVTANAAELSENGFTPIGQLPASGWWAQWDKNNLVSAGAEADFMFKISGNNVKEVTYSIENGAFAVPNRNSRLLSAKKAKNSGYMPKRADKSFYSMLTTSYDDQLDTANDNVEIMFNAAIEDKTLSSDLKSFSKLADLWVDEADGEELEKYRSITENYFNSALKNCSLTVGVRYTDGTAETKKLALSASAEIEKHPKTVAKLHGSETTGTVYNSVVTLKAKII